MSFIDTFNYYYYDLADPRIADWLFVKIWTVAIILSSYLYFVLLFGPRYMRNRPAYDLKTFMKFYNVFQIVTNAYIVKEFLAAYPDGIAFKCLPMDYSMNPAALRGLKACQLTAILKIIDLIETGVFILRKKNNQITFLHLYHHISTLLISLGFIRYFASGMSLFVPFLNCLVHVIMYTYYLLSNIDGPIKKISTSFKRYITIIQMVQFVLLEIQCIIGLLPSCPVPKLPAVIMFCNILLNFLLFYNFYKKTYLQSKMKKHENTL